MANCTESLWKIKNLFRKDRNFDCTRQKLTDTCAATHTRALGRDKGGLSRPKSSFKLNPCVQLSSAPNDPH